MDALCWLTISGLITLWNDLRCNVYPASAGCWGWCMLTCVGVLCKHQSFYRCMYEACIVASWCRACDSDAGCMRVIAEYVTNCQIVPVHLFYNLIWATDWIWSLSGVENKTGGMIDRNLNAASVVAVTYCSTCRRPQCMYSIDHIAT